MVPLFVGWLAAQAAYDPTWAVEISRGPVLGPARVVGMGAAYVSIAEGAGSMELNSAACAARSIHNGDQYFDWDWSLDTQTSLGNYDLENNRLRGDGSGDLGAAAGSLSFQVGRFGLGASLSAQSLSLGDTESRATQLAISTGYNLLDGQIVLGVQMLLGTADADFGGRSFRHFGVGLAFGGLARPKGDPFTFGFSWRPRYELEPNRGEAAGQPVGPTVVPSVFRVPAQIVIGMAYALGGRSANRPGTFGSLPDGVEPDPLPPEREKYVIAADLIYTEESERSTGFEAWSQGNLQPIRDVVPSIGFRVGIDTEPIHDRLQYRLGAYFEPTRFFGGRGRTHVTSGFDVRLFELVWMWRAGAAIDLSRDYSNLILSVGFWH